MDKRDIIDNRTRTYNRAGEIFSYIGNMAMGFGIGKLTANAKPLPDKPFIECPTGIYNSHGVLYVIADITIPTPPTNIQLRPGKMVIIINPSINRGNLVPYCGNINILDITGTIAPHNYQTIPMQYIYKALDQLRDWHMPLEF